MEGLWITHYHDDHVEAAPDFRETFNCQIMAETHVADIIENPLAWRLPCISSMKVPVDRSAEDGEAWRWHEFWMKVYHFPGQTLYHRGGCSSRVEELGCSLLETCLHQLE
ncbi:MAG: MBL fold metallo-hydrolase [Thermoproteota archaeon]